MNDTGEARWTGTAVTQMDVAEIKFLMLLKEVNPIELQKILDAKGVKELQELDWLTAKNFLEYLHSAELT